MADRVVLDASAVLAVLNGEAGADAVEAALGGAEICSVNLAEVAGKLLDSGVPERDARRALDALAISVVPFDDALAWRAGALRVTTRRAGLSLGDRACLALGLSRGARVLTTDLAWVGLVPGADVVCVR